jgi:hypothetical protein
MFISASPADGTRIVEQARALGLPGTYFDGSNILSSAQVRQDLGAHAEGIYVTVTPFVLGATGKDFATAYQSKYNQAPIFAAPFGYDAIAFIALAAGNTPGSSADFLARAATLGSFNSLNGTLPVTANREINPTLTTVIIKNGALVPIESER